MIDGDVLFYLVEDLAKIAKQHDPERFRGLVDEALLQRAKETVALHAHIGQEDWPNGSLRLADDSVVHWEVLDISQALPGFSIFADIGPSIHFAACGIGAADLPWEVATIDERPVTCPSCLDLMVRSGALAPPVRFREWL